MEKNSSTFERASSLLMERFPQLALLAASAAEKEAPEEIFPPLDIEKAEVVYVYGLGTGSAYSRCKEWLQKDLKRQLIFLEEDLGILASFLQREQAVEILSDPQVHFASVDVAALADRFPVKRVEVIAPPSLQGKKFQKLRLEILRKTALAHVLHLDRLHGHQPFQSFLKNVKHLPGSFYANGMKEAFKGVPAIICGAGPSLNQSMDVLKTLEQKALLIAGGSTLAALSSQGVIPHFGMAVDPNLEEYRRMKNSFAFEVPLLYSTRVFPGVFQTCNGPFGYMRSGIGGMPELWMEEELGLQDPLLGELLSDESVSVTAICVAWAVFLGCNPILLNGVDMAYTGKKRYAAGVAEEEEIPFKGIDAEKSAADRIVKRKSQNGKMVHTAIRWVMESASIAHFAKMHEGVRFINTSDGGLPIPGIDFMPLAQAAEPFFEKKMDLRRLVHEKIEASPMPKHAREIIDTKIAALKLSLQNVISCLRILAGLEKGSTALAEMDLREEIAYLYLFYDAEQVLSHTHKEGEKWAGFLDLALRYESVFAS